MELKPLNKEAVDELTEEQKEFNKELLALINKYMAHPAGEVEPDFALGLIIGSITDAMSEYSATFRIYKDYDQSWSEACIHGFCENFKKRHMETIQRLEKQNLEAPDDPSKLS